MAARSSPLGNNNAFRRRICDRLNLQWVVYAGSQARHESKKLLLQGSMPKSKVAVVQEGVQAIMKRRGQYEGTILEEKPGRWVACLTAVYVIRDGKRRRVRKKFVASTRGEVHAKLTDALNKQQRASALRRSRRSSAPFWRSG
jgi:hypothetical protein